MEGRADEVTIFFNIVSYSAFIMNKTYQKIFILIVISLIISQFSFTNVTASSVFGNIDTENSSLIDSNSEQSITKNSEHSGEVAEKKVAKFKNPEEFNAALGRFFMNIRWGIGFLSAFGTITSFLIFSVAFLRLATAPSSAMLRRKVMVDILQSGVATVLLGGLTLIMTIYYKTFSKFINNSLFLSADYKNAFAMALIEYKYLICGIMGILALTMFIIFIKDIVVLAASGGNPKERADAMKGLLTTGMATIGFGGTGVFVAMFNGLLTF